MILNKKAVQRFKTELKPILQFYLPKIIFEIQDKLETKFSKRFSYTKVKNAYRRIRTKLFGKSNNDAKRYAQVIQCIQ